jgi:hypothetical protein
MAEIVNLRTARKRKTRAQKEKAAQENRVLHGRTRVEREVAEVLREREASTHEAHRREGRVPDGET